MASNRDPRKDYRINRRGRKVTSSADRSKRAKKASAPKPTSSSTRSRRRGTGVKRLTFDQTRTRTGSAKVTSGKGIKARTVRTKPLTGGPRGAQGPRTAPVQGPYRKPNNIVFDIPQRTTKPAKAGGPPTPGVKFDPSKKVKTPAIKAKPGMKGGDKGLRALGAAALAGALSTGSLRNPISKAKKKEAAKSIDKFNTRDADGKVRSRKKVGPKKVGPKIVGPKKVGTIAEAFDKAYAKAKKAGKATFSFQGKLYSTK